MTTDVTPHRPTDLNGRVAEEIRVAMLRRRVSGRQLAQLLGVSPTWISYRLTGAQAMGLDDLERIAGALNVRVEELLVTPPDHQTAPSSRPPDRRPPGHPGVAVHPTGLPRSTRTQRVLAA